MGGAVYGHDHFAMGESGPYAKDHAKRCMIRNFQESAKDLRERLQDVKTNNPDKPLKAFENINFSY